MLGMRYGIIGLFVTSALLCGCNVSEQVLISESKAGASSKNSVSDDSSTIRIGGEETDIDDVSVFDALKFTEYDTLEDAVSASGADASAMVFPENVDISGVVFSGESYSAAKGVVRVAYFAEDGSYFLMERGDYEGVSFWSGFGYEFGWNLVMNDVDVECFGTNDGIIEAAEWIGTDGVRTHVQLVVSDGSAEISVDDLKMLVQ